MSVKSGFFNSIDGDRKYDATQLSSVFDGLIVDGVFASIGTAFVVKADVARTVNVGIGKAWFNGTWIHNDAILPIEMPEADTLLDRIDAIVIEINKSDPIRENSIKVVQGELASTPQRPAMKNEERIQHHPICYIKRPAKSFSISQSQITNMVGTEEMPFVTGILQTVSLDELLGKWQDELDNFVEYYTSNIEEWTEAQKQEFLDWAANRKQAYADWLNEMKLDLAEERAELDEWINIEQAKFEDWFISVKDQLSSDAAGNLQLQIDEISKKEFERYYNLVNKVVDINKDSSGNTTSIVETTDEAVCTTTFETTDVSTTIITTCVPVEGFYDYTKTAVITTVETGTKITESYTKTVKEV
jgi:hypothetical protein